MPSAIQHLQRAVQIDPKLADGYYYLAEALYKSKRNSEAKSALVHCLQIDPTSSKAKALLPKLGQN
jgi:cytochrome c-type biogenesis protein CcmH/NrfG